MDKNEIKDFLHVYQYRRKLSLAYVFLTKQGMFFLIFCYFAFSFLPFFLAVVVSMWIFWGIYKNNFNYIYTEKKQIYLIRKIRNYLLGVKNGY